MKDEQMLCLQIITDVGTARSKYIEAIQEAKTGNYELCNQRIKEGNDCFANGHRTHAKLLEMDAAHHADLSILLIHAEDQLMCAETFKLLCHEFLDVYRRMDMLKSKEENEMQKMP